MDNLLSANHLVIGSVGIFRPVGALPRAVVAAQTVPAVGLCRRVADFRICPVTNTDTEASLAGM